MEITAPDDKYSDFAIQAVVDKLKRIIDELESAPPHCGSLPEIFREHLDFIEMHKIDHENHDAVFEAYTYVLEQMLGYLASIYSTTFEEGAADTRIDTIRNTIDNLRENLKVGLHEISLIYQEIGSMIDQNSDFDVRLDDSPCEKGIIDNIERFGLRFDCLADNPDCPSLVQCEVNVRSENMDSPIPDRSSIVVEECRIKATIEAIPPLDDTIESGCITRELVELPTSIPKREVFVEDAAKYLYAVPQQSNCCSNNEDFDVEACYDLYCSCDSKKEKLCWFRLHLERGGTPDKPKITIDNNHEGQGIAIIFISSASYTWEIGSGKYYDCMKDGGNEILSMNPLKKWPKRTKSLLVEIKEIMNLPEVPFEVIKLNIAFTIGKGSKGKNIKKKVRSSLLTMYPGARGIDDKIQLALQSLKSEGLVIEDKEGSISWGLVKSVSAIDPLDSSIGQGNCSSNNSSSKEPCSHNDQENDLGSSIPPSNGIENTIKLLLLEKSSVEDILINRVLKSMNESSTEHEITATHIKDEINNLMNNGRIDKDESGVLSWLQTEPSLTNH